MTRLLFLLASFAVLAQDATPARAPEIPWKLQAEYMSALAREHFLAWQLSEAKKETAATLAVIARECPVGLDLSGRFPVCKLAPPVKPPE